MLKGILGRKVGMTQVYVEGGRLVPVTAIEAGPCVVIQKKTRECDGYEAIQVGFLPQAPGRLTKPQQGHFAKAGAGNFKVVRELRLADAETYQLGQEIRADSFNQGDRVDVKGISKGKGFAGGIKRHGFHRGPSAHGSKYHRRPGSLAAKGPARVFKGRKLPGHLGAQRVTALNLEVIQADPVRNLLLVKGSVPGPNNGLVVIRDSVRS